MRYPALLTEDDNGAIVIEFPDVPEAIATGADREEALFRGVEVLTLALAEYVARRRPIPVPSPVQPEQVSVMLRPLVAAKLALAAAMVSQGVTQVELARRLAIDGRQVRRLLDLRHGSRIEHLEAALAVFGKSIELTVRDAA
jgi:antitoxin HicB